jgi:hypothetical protein
MRVDHSDRGPPWIALYGTSDIRSSEHVLRRSEWRLCCRKSVGPEHRHEWLALHERSDLVASQRLRAERPLNARYLRDLRCSPIGDEHKSVGSGSR